MRLIRSTFFFLSLAASASPQADYSKPYVFTTLAGASSIGSADGTGSAARFFQPQGVAADAAGNIYVADSDNHTIRKISPGGSVTTFAGVSGYAGRADGPGPSARFDFPSSLVLDGAGNLYVADANNHAIRKITPTGLVSTFAGALGVSGHADGNVAAARFHRPEGIAIDLSGNLYIADAGNHVIRRISPGGVVSTVAGSPDASGSVDGTGNAARFSAPFRVAVDATGTLYVSDSTNWDIRKVTPAGAVTTVYPAKFAWLFGGIPNDTKMPQSLPAGIAVAASGRVFFADSYRHAIFEISPTGTVAAVAGSGEPTGYGGRLYHYGSGGADGQGPAASFLEPVGLAADAAGNLWVADMGNNCIRKVSAGAEVTTIAGLPLDRSIGYRDGAGANARFGQLTGIAVDAADTVYVADGSNHAIRKISPNGIVSTLAGGGGNGGYTDGTGTAARFSYPDGVAVDGAGNVFVLDRYNNVIRKISPEGLVTTLAGRANEYGLMDGPDGTARFFRLWAIATNAAGDLHVFDWQRVRRISAGGTVSTRPLSFLEGDYFVSGLAVDDAGSVYLAGDHAIRRLAPDDQLTTLAGVPSTRTGIAYTSHPGSIDGPGSTARFNGPRAVAVSGSGRLFVTDTDNFTIRQVAPDGIVSTIAGLAGKFGATDGVGADARFFDPVGIAIGPSGTLYVADGTTIHKGVPAGPPVITGQPQNLTVAAGGAVQVSVTATGTPAPTFQWFHNGAPFAGATQSTLSFTNARASDAGDYTVVATNALGTVTSNKATLTVTGATGPGPGTPSTGGSSGGGGAISIWSVLALAVAGTIRRLTGRSRS